ncbi:hypothetical protein [Streptomyces sp. NBC_01264]|uniref:hypothetical protein n=1 Tax=Streptomyces sp. NBC_01264 TaxID=2903804 RepID=UPI002256022F|nr:hypothetical protein [Streptomyces sp. NBC_01264]MCX4783029.1 hypothetical protein [Streptomyces sp. NBC_01264]
MLTRLTDRDERALLVAAENRIAEPLHVGAALVRVGAALAAVRRLLRRERESVTCHPTAAPQSSTEAGPPRRTAPGPLPR